MPDQKGVLSQEELRKAEEWFKKHWPENYVCPISGHSNWTIGGHLVAPMTISGGGGVVNVGAIYPQVMVICGGCGFTLFFNAVMIGIYPPAEPLPQQTKTSEEPKPAPEPKPEEQKK